MKVQNGWSCSVFFLLHMIHIAWTQKFDVIGPSTDIFALLGEDVTLPVLLSPPLNAQGFEVTWVQNELQSLVLLYQDFQIKNEYQMQAFKGRTALFPEELMSGNVSMRLQDVHISDSGLYRCLVASGLWNEETHLTLNVEVVGTQPSISISTTEDQQTRLECSSEKWSFRPEVTWRDKNGVDVTSQSTLTVQRDDEGLLRVSSIISIKWEFNVFSCLMRSNTTRPAHQSKMGIYVFSPNVSGWSVVFWLLMALCVTATVLLILKWRRMRDKKATYKTKAIIDILPVWNLRKEIEMTQHPALTLKFSKVINGFSHEDFLKITEYYKPQLAYVMNFDISRALQLLVNKRILTNDEAKVSHYQPNSEQESLVIPPAPNDTLDFRSYLGAAV
uniref:Butyrophilin-like protein 2 n=1 Tax=Erpetoichthys calabaricus TaxID=27687 RepID=A0A8C4T071_ERPCA